MSGMINKVKDALTVSILPPTTARGHCTWCRVLRRPQKHRSMLTCSQQGEKHTPEARAANQGNNGESPSPSPVETTVG